MTDKTYEVGQELLYVPTDRRRGEPYPVTVTKVGRKWVYITRFGHDSNRFDPATGAVDGGQYTPPASVWRSREEWEAACALQREWSHFRRALDRNMNPPEGVSMADIERAATILGVNYDR